MLKLTLSFDRINNEEALNHCLGEGGYCGMQMYSAITNSAIVWIDDVANEMEFLSKTLVALHKLGFEFTLESDFEGE